MNSEYISLPPSETKLIKEPVVVDNFILSEAAEFEKGNLDQITQWLTDKVGKHRDEYRLPFVLGKLADWWQKKESSPKEMGKIRVYQFALPTSGSFKEGIADSSILLVATDAGGFSVASPDVSVKEVEIAYLSKIRENGELKDLPFIQLGSPTTRLPQNPSDNMVLGTRIGFLRQELGKKRIEELWYLLLAALKTGKLNEVLSSEASEQIKTAWDNLCYDYTEVGRTYVSHPTQTDTVYVRNLPYPGYSIYKKGKIPALTFSDIKPGTLGHKMVFDGYKEPKRTFPEEFSGDLSQVSGILSGV